MEFGVWSLEFGVWSLEFGVWRVESGRMKNTSQNGDNTAKVKSKRFAVRIVRLYQYLVDKKKEFVLSKQILRSGTSIGANLAEAECAISRNEFVAKVYIALKECAETLYWLELLQETDYLSSSEFKSVSADCLELRKMLSSTTKTMKTDNSKLQSSNSKPEKRRVL
ncbi:MAG: four helix bundle protein [Victivallaceae bacterium]|nr:four helix bundle protein [Victivallaceae bacterium]